MNVKKIAILLLFIFSLTHPASIFATGLADTDWPTVGGNSAHNKVSPSTNEAPLTIGCRAEIKYPYKFQSSVAIGKKSFYILMQDGSYKPALIGSLDGNTFSLTSYDFNCNLIWKSEKLGSGSDSLAQNPTIGDDGVVYIAATHGGTIGKQQGIAYTVRAHPDTIPINTVVYGSLGPSLPVSNGGLIQKTSFTSPPTGALLAIRESDGEFLWSGCITGELYNGTPVFDGRGRLVLLSGGGDTLFSCNLDGTLNWARMSPIANWMDGQIAVDKLGHIYTRNGNAFASYSAERSDEIWRTDSYLPTDTGVYAVLSPNEETVYFETAGNVYAIQTKDGSLLWKRENISFSGIGSIGRVYLAETKALDAINSKTGALIWSYKMDEKPTEVVVDKNENIILRGSKYVYVLSSDGELKFRYSLGKVETAVGIPSIKRDGSIVFLSSSNITSHLNFLRPWKISNLAVEIGNNKNVASSNLPITFTAKTSMIQRDLASRFNNQMQVKLSDGQTIPLKYKEAQGEETVWTGVYKVPSKTLIPNLKGTVEAIAYSTTTTKDTHFGSLSEGFNNTGVTFDFSLNSTEPGKYTFDSEHLSINAHTEKSLNWFEKILEAVQKMIFE